MSDRPRVVVLGYVARGPIGGMAWHSLQYALGLARMGHEVLFVEDTGDDEAAFYDPRSFTMTADPSFGVSWTRNAFASVGLGDNWAVYNARVGEWLGDGAAFAPSFCRTADVIINVSGVNPLRDWYDGSSTLFIDTDPAFQQARMEAEPAWHDYVASHDVHCSFAELIGQPECSVPTRDLVWHATRQPVVLDVWPVQSAPRDGAFTTVMQWESYRRRVLHGIELHMKDASMEPMWDLPGRVGVTLEMALGGKAAPRTALAAAGWSLRDPMEVSASLWTYQQYLQSSRGEFSVAKHGYVVTRTGWFSERSANYLASGRPVVTEDTGFSKWMTTGLGILSFRTADEAAAAVCEVAGNYDAHARAARELAEEYFDATTVLTALLDLVR